MKKGVRKLVVLAVLYGGFLLFLFSTDPHKLAVGWLILPFIWLFVALYLTFVFLFGALRHRNLHPAPRRPRLTAAVIAGVPSFLLILDSVDQLTLKDFLILIVFAAVVVFYASRLNLRH